MPDESNATPREPQLTDLREWPPDTNTSEVVHFASKEFPTRLLLWVAAVREKDYLRAEREEANMRRVVARIFAYRRMRQRTDAKRGNTTNESHSGN